jgi:hypothetical protein
MACLLLHAMFASKNNAKVLIYIFTIKRAHDHTHTRTPRARAHTHTHTHTHREAWSTAGWHWPAWRTWAAMKKY